MKDELLFDASALYQLLLHIVKGKVNYQLLSRIIILDLTFYEIGNVIWKETVILKKLKDPEKLANRIFLILKRFKIVRVNDLEYEEILKTAINNNLTFYDASYLYASRKFDYTLVTNDTDLLQRGGVNINDVLK